MNKEAIKRHLEAIGVDSEQRIKRKGGGQYLVNLLHEFAEKIRNETLGDVVGAVRKMRK